MATSTHDRILLVDSNHTSCMRVRDLLEIEYEVVTAASGEQAMFILAQNNHGITLILTDINLPDVNSFEFVKMAERETRLPIITMHDTSDRQLMMQDILSGAMHCIVRPLNYDNIKYLWISTIVKRHEVSEESRTRHPRMAVTPKETPLIAVKREH